VTTLAHYVGRQHDSQPAILSLPLETSDVWPLYYRLHSTESTMKRPSLLFRHNCHCRMTAIHAHLHETTSYTPERV